MNGLTCPEDYLEDSAQKLKVLGHPLRLKILCLIERSAACVSDLWQCLEQPQPVVSQHLAILKEKGIVDSRTEGNRRIYFIADAQVQSLVKILLTDHAPAC